MLFMDRYQFYYIALYNYVQYIIYIMLVIQYIDITTVNVARLFKQKI